MKPLHVAVVAFALLSAGCVTRQQFRFVQSQPSCFGGSDPINGLPKQGEPWPSIDCRHTLYTVGYVEFRSDGTFIDQKQHQLALKLIDQARTKAPGGKVIAVVYVHGWQNNASEAAQGGKPKDVERFRSALLELGARSRDAARDAAVREGLSPSTATPIPVVGIYLGWRGKSLMGPSWFTFLSYWGRRNTGNNVGDGADVATTLNDVIRKVNENSDSRILLVGHSFGARVLEHAIERKDGAVKLYEASDDPSDVNARKPLVDLALYVNSANDARLSMARVQALQADPIHVRHPDYAPARCKTEEELATPQCRDYPLLVAITSRGDLATKYLLPTANRINLDDSAPDPKPPTGTFADKIPSPGIYKRSAAGHLKFMQSHVVREVSCPTDDDLPSLIVNPQTPLTLEVRKEVAKALNREKELDKVLAQEAAARNELELLRKAMLRPVCPIGEERCRFVFRTQSEEPACYQVDQRPIVEVTLPPKKNGEAPVTAKAAPFNSTAFWIMDVDAAVIKDHGDIWNLSFVEMLGQLMAPRGFFEPGAARIKIQAGRPGAP